MDRLGISGQVIADARADGRGAFIAYLPVGYPTVETSIEAMQAAIEGTDGSGADIVEIGMPYSDPLMDGATIQYATTRALDNGVRTRDIFTAVSAVRQAGATPTVMIYWNLVEQYGVDAFARDLANAGGAGLVTPDYIPDDAAEWFEASDKYGLDRIFLIAPSSTDDRIASTIAACRGWVYATAVMGVTGAREETSDAAPVIVQRARQADPELPVGVGLGISTADQAAETVSYADAAIVGSALVRKLIEHEANPSAGVAAVRTLAAELAEGVRRTSR